MRDSCKYLETIRVIKLLSNLNIQLFLHVATPDVEIRLKSTRFQVVCPLGSGFINSELLEMALFLCEGIKTNAKAV